jgi:hypothetical protein
MLHFIFSENLSSPAQPEISSFIPDAMRTPTFGLLGRTIMINTDQVAGFL